MNARSTLLAGLALVWLGADLHAQAPVAAPALPRYPGIRTQFNISLSEVSTVAGRVDVFRTLVRRTQFGWITTRSHGILRPGRFYLDPYLPRVSTSFVTLASTSPTATGNFRTLLYSNSLEADGRFRVLGLNRPRRNSLGRTDADVVFRHQPTGLQVRLEVKDMSPASQRSKLGEIKTQILKMAQDARLTVKCRCGLTAKTYVRKSAPLPSNTQCGSKSAYGRERT
jgi:hypothetical protein